MPAGDELVGTAPGDVKFDRPLGDGRPEDGRPEDGRPDAGEVKGGASEEAGTVSGALALAEDPGEDPVPAGAELVGRLPDDVPFPNGPLEDGRPEEGRPEDGIAEGAYSVEDSPDDAGPVSEALEAGADDDPAPVVKGIVTGALDDPPEDAGPEPEVLGDAGPVVSGMEPGGLGLAPSDDEAFHDGPLGDGRPDEGKPEDGLLKDDDLVGFEYDDDDEGDTGIVDCG